MLDFVKSIFSRQNKEEESKDPLKPKSLDEYVNQENAKLIVASTIAGALRYEEPLKPLLFVGPPGVGKTTLAVLTAIHAGRPYIVETPTTLNVLQKKVPIYLINTIKNVNQARGALIIDEIQLLNKQAQAVLLPVLAERRLYLDRPIEVVASIMGTTTEAGTLDWALLSRFTVVVLDYYDEQALFQIVKATAKRMGLYPDDEVLMEIAKRSQGVPRNANNLLLAARDMAALAGKEVIDMDTLNRTFLALMVTPDGLTMTQLQILVNLASAPKFTLSINTLAQIVGAVPKALVEDLRFLVRKGYVVVTPRGRTLTKEGYEAAVRGIAHLEELSRVFTK
jgi:Holliday junction DNA helicase RuvB